MVSHFWSKAFNFQSFSIDLLIWKAFLSYIWFAKSDEQDSKCVKWWTLKKHYSKKEKSVDDTLPYQSASLVHVQTNDTTGYLKERKLSTKIKNKKCENRLGKVWEKKKRRKTDSADAWLITRLDRKWKLHLIDDIKQTKSDNERTWSKWRGEETNKNKRKVTILQKMFFLDTTVLVFNVAKL